jgi:Zn-dependent peptidase ImmA (M78 family)
MKVFHPHGTKERLFEMMKRVGKLNEQVLPIEKKAEIVNKFVGFVDGKLDFDDVPMVKLSFDETDAQKNKSFGRYNPATNEIVVVAVNRNLADVLRTIAHELVHYKQNKMGKLNINSGKTGSTEENQANALAGILMREFGQLYPEIFE